MEDIIKTLSDKITRIKNIVSLSKFTSLLIENNFNPVLIINMNNSFFEESAGNYILLDNKIKDLIKLVYSISPSNLIFICDKEYKFYDRIQDFLNSLNFTGEESYNYYRIIFSPDINNESTFHLSLNSYLINNDLILRSIPKTCILYLDNSQERVKNIKYIVNDENIKYFFFVLDSKKSFFDFMNNEGEYKIIDSIYNSNLVDSEV
uniref:Uncharacterized protein n=1 Tax=viral metagenome TaxID=1070528 RepID=A0A6C0BC63_9ZZZZ